MIQRASQFVWMGTLAPTLAVILSTGCDRFQANPPSAKATKASNELPHIQTVKVGQQDLKRTIELPGTIEGYETADLFAKVGGYVEQVAVDIGDRVAEDQVLAALSIPEMEKELNEKEAAIESAKANAEQAKAGIKQAQAEAQRTAATLEEAKSKLAEKEAQLAQYQAEYDRIAGLVENGSLNQKLLEEVTYRRDAAQAALKATSAGIRTAEASVAAAEANIDKARTDHRSMLARVKLAEAAYEHSETMMQYATIRAPFDGLVTKRMVDPGAFVQSAAGNSAAKPLITVTRTDVVRIFLDLPMAEVKWLNQGDRILLDRINVLPDERFEGQVARFAASLDRVSRMMRVEVDLENPEHRLLPGYYGYVTLYLDEYGDTPVIPSSALMADNDETYVFVVDDDGQCRKCPVATNYQDGSIVGIDSGLSGGEQIVEAGGGQLSDGQRIVAVPDTAQRE